MRALEAVALTMAVAVAGRLDAQTDAERAAAPGLNVWTASGRSPYGVTFTSDIASFEVDRPTHVALFEAGRDGRLRVLFPRSPRDTGLVKAHKTYSAVPLSGDLMFGSPFSMRVPVTFAIASDEPIDLSKFGEGKRWQRQVSLREDADPDVLMEAVARMIVPRDSTVVAAEYAYVAPPMNGRAFFALAQCVGLSSFSLARHDYWFYRDMWGIGGPVDMGWYFGLSQAQGFWSAFGPLYGLSRAHNVANYRFGAGCGSDQSLSMPRIALGAVPVAPRQPVTPTDSTPRDTSHASPPALRVPRNPVVVATLEQEPTPESAEVATDGRRPLRPAGFTDGANGSGIGRRPTIVRDGTLGNAEPLASARRMQPRGFDGTAGWRTRTQGDDRLGWRSTPGTAGRASVETLSRPAAGSGPGTGYTPAPRDVGAAQAPRSGDESRVGGRAAPTPHTAAPTASAPTIPKQ